jgi:hypothetical protein
MQFLCLLHGLGPTPYTPVNTWQRSSEPDAAELGVALGLAARSLGKSLQDL